MVNNPINCNHKIYCPSVLSTCKGEKCHLINRDINEMPLYKMVKKQCEKFNIDYSINKRSITWEGQEY